MKTMKAILLSLLLCCLFSAAQAEPLSIAGSYSGSIIRAYQREHPEAELTLSDYNFASIEELINVLLFQDKSFDIMTLHTGSQDIDLLIEKGYCPTLDDSEIITEAVRQMYPSIQEGVTVDGHIYALPLSAWCTELAYDPQMLEELGLELPHSFADMAELVNSWQDLPPEISEDYAPVEMIDDYPAWFLLRSTEHYADTLAARGEPLHFDTPVYRELMALQSSITTALNDDWEDLPAPFQSGIDITYNPSLQLVPIELDGDIVYRGEMFVAVINPYSEHKEEAMAFLEWAAQSYTNTEKLYLFPGMTEPVENSWYPAQMAAWTEKHDELLDKLNTCEESERRFVQDELEEHEASLAAIEADRYAISPEVIAEWDKVMPNMAFIPPTEFNQSSDVFYTLMFRYLDGELPMEEYIQEMERVAQMIRMENGE